MNNEFRCEFPPDDCSNHGVCNRDGTACICDDSYVTYKPTGEKECNYRRKEQVVAFGLAWISCLTGAPYFYLGDTALGLVLLFTGFGGALVLTIFMCFSACCCSSKNNACFESLCKVLISLMIFQSSIWQIVLLFQLRLNKLNDSNGIALKSW